MAITYDAAQRAKQKAYDRLSPLVDIVGIGIGRRGQDYVVKVNLAVQPDPSITLPGKIGTVPVFFEVVGRIRASRAASRAAS